MADQQVGNVHGLPIVHKGDADSPPNLAGTNDPQVGFSDSDMLSIGALRTRLAAIDAGYYTADKLNEMTYNDMVFAVRQNDHATTIKQ